LLFRYTPGAFVSLMDFTEDGQYLSFDGGGYLVNVQLTGDDPFAREPIDLIREEFEVSVSRFSPDGRHVAYAYTESGRPEVFVTGFDAATGMVSASERVQVSTDGTIGGISWRADGGELYFVNENLDTEDEFNDVKVMAVNISSTPELSVGEPRELFTLTISPGGNSAQWQNASADGERFLFVVAAD
jgi:Tol biopolymer transport system component